MIASRQPSSSKKTPAASGSPTPAVVVSKATIGQGLDRLTHQLRERFGRLGCACFGEGHERVEVALRGQAPRSGRFAHAAPSWFRSSRKTGLPSSSTVSPDRIRTFARSSGTGFT